MTTRDFSSEALKAAQAHTSYIIRGKAILRVAYGAEPEDWGADRGPCHDCGATKGQFHIFGCDVERCPVCGGQVIYCECDLDDDGT